MNEEDDQSCFSLTSSVTPIHRSNEILQDPEYKVKYSSLPTIIEEDDEICPTEHFHEVDVEEKDMDIEQLMSIIIDEESQPEDLAQSSFKVNLKETNNDIELSMADSAHNRCEDPHIMTHQMKRELVQIRHYSEKFLSAQVHQYQALRYLALRWHMCGERVLMKRFLCWRWQTQYRTARTKETFQKKTLDRLDLLLRHHTQRHVQKRFLQWKWMEQDFLQEQLSLVYQKLTRCRADLWKMKQQRLQELKLTKPGILKYV